MNYEVVSIDVKQNIICSEVFCTPYFDEHITGNNVDKYTNGILPYYKLFTLNVYIALRYIYNAIQCVD